MFALLLVLLTQVPCGAQETTTVCFCKQGSATACEALRQTDAELANRLEAAAQAAAQIAAKVEEDGKATETALAGDAASSASPEPPNCKGQLHHIISRPIAKALDRHATLRGHYKPRDPRFTSRAVDEKSHCGYQQWHRNVDERVIKWLETNRQATTTQFEAFLREIYREPAMRTRFPHGF